MENCWVLQGFAGIKNLTFAYVSLNLIFEGFGTEVFSKHALEKSLSLAQGTCVKPQLIFSV